MHWKQAAKRVAYWTVPPGIQNLLRAYIRRSRELSSLDPSVQAVLDRNKVLLNRHAGERCFVLATGPSIKNQDLKPLEGENCIAVSNFYVHPAFAVVKPRYYCVVSYHPPITEEAWQGWLAEMAAGTGDAVMFFSLADRERVQRNGLFAGRKIHYLKFGGSWDMLIARGVNITRSVPSAQSVTIMALMIAIYTGFRQIYLLGCDHDWILHLNESSHFYKENQHALSRKGYNEWFGADLESYCQDYIRLWQQYKALQRITNDQSIQIYNATAGGLLDVFPRVNYESLFNKSLDGGLPYL